MQRAVQQATGPPAGHQWSCRRTPLEAKSIFRVPASLAANCAELKKSEATLRETSCAIYRWSCAGMYFAGAEVSAHSAVQPALQAAAQLSICRKFEGTFGFAILQVKRRSNASSRPVTDYTVYATMDLLSVPWCIDALAISSPTSNVPA